LQHIGIFVAAWIVFVTLAWWFVGYLQDFSPTQMAQSSDNTSGVGVNLNGMLSQNGVIFFFQVMVTGC
jgi:hypothetical protein